MGLEAFRGLRLIEGSCVCVWEGGEGGGDAWRGLGGGEGGRKLSLSLDTM